MAKTSGDKKYIRDSIENVQTNEITISEDKLRIKLEKQIANIRKGCGVFGYLSVAITCVGVLVSVDLKEFYGITPDMWKMFFILMSLIFIGLFFYSSFYAIFHRTTVDTIVKDIKTIDCENTEKHFWGILVDLIKTKKTSKKETEEESE